MAGYQFRLIGGQTSAFGRDFARFDEPDLAARFQALIGEAMVKTGQAFEERDWQGAFAVVLSVDEHTGHLVLGFQPEYARTEAEFDNPSQE